MKYESKDSTLTLYYEGQINSANAPALETDSLAALMATKPERVVIDCATLEYISSAGLRVLLRIKQTCSSVKLINVKPDVYQVLEMTGFLNIVEAKKAFREVAVKEEQLIGTGFCSKVYRIAPDTIVKVFLKGGIDAIERELALAKSAFVAGIPTAITFDVVRVGDHYGAMFEMLDFTSLHHLFEADLKNIPLYLDRYAALLKKINSTPCLSKEVPSAKEKILTKLGRIKDLLSPAEFEKANAFVNTLAETNTLVHGDCHIKNILVDKDELLLIDMDTLSYGNPYFEYAGLYTTYIGFSEDDPGNFERFFNIPDEKAAEIFHELMKRLGYDDEAHLAGIRILSYIHMVDWTRRNQKDNAKRLNGCLTRLKELLSK